MLLTYICTYIYVCMYIMYIFDQKSLYPPLHVMVKKGKCRPSRLREGGKIGKWGRGQKGGG